jgi:hypothetical protein
MYNNTLQKIKIGSNMSELWQLVRNSIILISVHLLLSLCEVFINSLKTKLRPLYLKTQSVPRRKHFSSRL